MSFTTRPAPLDIGVIHPDLLPLRRQTTRLHPRARANLPFSASKIGGTFLANNPATWPRCEQHDTPHIGVLQAIKADVPDLTFPEGMDVFQLTFCPFDHEDDYSFGPAVAGRWLSLQAEHEQFDTNPPHRNPTERYLPNECALHPEVVHEFPPFDELPAPLQKAIANDRSLVNPLVDPPLEIVEDEFSTTAYDWFYSVADGTKVGGYVRWIQDPEYPTCTRCDGQTEHLLTMASWEWDGGTYQRWKPLELDAKRASVRTDGGDDHGMMFGDAGAIYVCICRNCEGWPIYRSFQCS